MTTGRKSSAVPRKADDKQQSRAFIEKSRELEADGDDGAKGDLLMGRLAKMKPEPRAKKSKPKPN